MAKMNDSLSDIENSRYAYWETDPVTGEYIYRDSEGRTRAEIIEDYQDNANRLNAISGVYQRADRIITRDGSLTVTVVDDKEMDTPAMSNGKEIILNGNLIEDLNNDTITSLHGINYHELGHILYSPRAGSDLGKYVKARKLVRAMQYLEEGRVEKLLTAKYPSTKLFLEATAMEYLLKGNPEEWGEQFATFTGRTYLSLDIRQVIADKFIAKYGVGLADTVHSIVHEYRTLVFPKDFDRAKELLESFANIVGYDVEPPTKPNWGGHKCNGSVPQKGRPEGQAEQERLQNKSKNESSEDIGDGAGKPNETPYQGEEKVFTDEDSLIADKLTERMKQIKSNPIVKREITETRKAIANSDEMRSSMRSLNTTQRTPSVGAIGLARKFGRELERIIKDSEPHWNRRLPSGKLNVTRTMNPDINAIGQMFDEWDTGNPNTEIEAVILTDNSGSMGSRMTQVCENSWIMKRGIEKINGSVTVYSFNHESKLVYDKSEKAKATQYEYVYSGGNTNPIRALVEGERLLSTSKKPIKLAFIITDGEWEREEECDSIIKRMNANGVLTCVIFIGDVGRYKEIVESSRTGDMYSIRALQRIRHNAKVFKAVAEPSDVLKLATALVKETLTK